MSIEVHIDWRGQTHLVGRLHSDERSPSASFEYTPEWLAQEGAFPIDPTALPLQRSPHHGKSLFGALQDCGPDRWGRVLIERAVRKKFLQQRPYREIDYVLALDDTSRIGALRFRLDAKSPFLASGSGKIPPLVSLSALLNAADAIHGETETAKDLRLLLGEGSPLGGARPKSAVALADGSLAIAKFPKPDDTRDVADGEMLGLQLACESGIRTAGFQLVKVGQRSVMVVNRFDRVGSSRIPFISAYSLLGLPQGDPGAYTLIADAIRQFGNDVAGDLEELWRRLVFSLLTSNYDDHLRNHGFLMLEPGRWSLSPAYDINPVPEIDRPTMNKTPITEMQEEASLEIALSAAPRFGIKGVRAKEIVREVFSPVSVWRKTGQRLRIKAATLDAYASAFEHPLMDEAREILKG